MSVSVGIDLVTVEQVEEAMARHGSRYLQRIYTEQELADSAGDPARLAARFAAKEATMKALGRSDEGIGWRCIAVHRAVHGQPTIELSGAAAELARSRGVTGLAVSLTHEPQHAAAIVLAETGL
jgi:holo-[acyl-carrier protein] synthase